MLNFCTDPPISAFVREIFNPILLNHYLYHFLQYRQYLEKENNKIMNVRFYRYELEDYIDRDSKHKMNWNLSKFNVSSNLDLKVVKLPQWTVNAYFNWIYLWKENFMVQWRSDLIWDNYCNNILIEKIEARIKIFNKT